jgi:hypothetical protein
VKLDTSKGDASSAVGRIVLTIDRNRRANLAVDADAQAKALRLRLHVLCPECARMIDIAEGNRPRRGVVGVDLLRHAAEEHSSWLELLGINE